MTASSYRESAKIYQFPTGGRRDEAKPAAHLAASRVAMVASGSAWYHEEAVQEAKRAPKN
jgi:hypothetical protein